MLELLRDGRWLRRLVLHTDSRRFVVVTLLGPIGTLVTVLESLWLRDLVDSVQNGRRQQALVYSGITAATVALVWLMAWAEGVARFRLSDEVSGALEIELIRLGTSLPTLDSRSSPTRDDDLALARQDRIALSQFPSALVQAVESVVGIVAAVVLLGSLRWWFCLLPLLALGPAWAGRRAELAEELAREGAAEHWRLGAHFLGLAISPSAAKETRVFGLEDTVVRGYTASVSRGNSLVLRATTRGALVSIAAWALFTLALGAGLEGVVQLAISGALTPGDVLLVIMLAAVVSGQLAGGVRTAGWLYRLLVKASRYGAFEEAAASRQQPAPAARARPSPPRYVLEGLRLEDVTFWYPGSPVPALRHVNAHLPAGSVVALVGENGTGKTTLIKLLCRLHDLQSGRITLDGQDIAEFDPGEWRRRVSGAFQDYCKFQFSVQHAVGIGDLPRVDDREAVLAALDRAGVARLVQQLPHGLATQLGTSFDAGVDLSAGQWRGVAIARGMAREGPLLSVWDEPGASLDVFAEARLYAHLAEAAGRAERRGSIAILVSHRLAPVTTADLIILLGDGTIREIGTHQELLALGGTYARMFRLQSRLYGGSTP